MEGLSKNYIAWKWKKNSVHVIETFRRNNNNRTMNKFFYMLRLIGMREKVDQKIYIYRHTPSIKIVAFDSKFLSIESSF